MKLHSYTDAGGFSQRGQSQPLFVQAKTSDEPPLGADTDAAAPSDFGFLASGGVPADCSEPMATHSGGNASPANASAKPGSIVFLLSDSRQFTLFGLNKKSEACSRTQLILLHNLRSKCS
jgi:hypothetical protein